MDIFASLLILGLVFANIACLNAEENSNFFNVLDYGAVSDGIADNSQAFLKAWEAACTTTSTDHPTVIIPRRKTFLVKPVSFNGPCKAKSITLLINGKIVAPSSPDTWKGLDASQWLEFKGVTGLNVTGSGRIDGRGWRWWNQSCRVHPELKGCTKLAPTAVKFLSCNETSLSNVHFINSSQAHVLIMGCTHFNINNLMIKAPETSPNTDGIHLQSVHYLSINNTVIRTGDDCISIGDYTSDVSISNVKCGPGHGISIGSLGGGGNYVQVENIHVSKVHFNGTTNGARIKTYQVGKGYVRGVTFEHIIFNKVKNPIIIDQNYCQVRDACKEQNTGVQISDVTYRDFGGTSSTDLAINLNCSRSVACTGISLESIRLKASEAGKKVASNCRNANGKAIGVVQPDSCLH